LKECQKNIFSLSKKNIFKKFSIFSNLFALAESATEDQKQELT